MATDREQARKIIEKLVAQFGEQYASYKKSSYDEAQLRVDFLNKFFKALGWDVDNEEGLAESYREVIYEDKLKVGKSTKAPDYGFRLSGSYNRRLFFVEAKKPSVEIKTDKAAAYQVRRYGRNAQTAISILTNFETLAIYDCTRKPSQNDSAGVGRIKYLGYKDYLTEFDFIYDTLSREAVLKGKFDKYVQTDTLKRGSITLDKDFVESLNLWRKYLAVSIAKNNLKLNEEQINYAVQQTIDRFIFLRFCEDRAVEHYGKLKDATAKGDAYKNLLEVFIEADNKYNSGLFDFEKDTITPQMKVDNKVIKNIMAELYPPKSEYEFSVMPVEILGNAYEQFLGKVIRITPTHGAKIDDKPEVRKAGGVYYTPQYIVDYIVQHTVGELIKGKSPKEIEKIKIVDPACGSGSFLLGAFGYLLNYHNKWYIDNGYREKKNGGGVLTPEGGLTTATKRDILLNNIYGVDLDANAVEVSKLSLLLKSMEGETEASINQQLEMFHTRVLPDLDKNILCGNSLIGHDFFDSELGFNSAEKEELQHRIKPFDWQNAFPRVFKQGGFDAVVGNPPYGVNISGKMDSYLRKKYSCANYQLDSYVLFSELGYKLLSKNGTIGFIIPTAWVASMYDKPFRKFLSYETKIESIVIAPKQAFKDATVETGIIIFSKNKPSETFSVKRWDMDDNHEYNVKVTDIYEHENFAFPIYSNPLTRGIINTIRKSKQKLSDFAEVIWGVKIYEKGKGVPAQKGNESDYKPFHSDKKVKSTHRPLIGGGEVLRYALKWNGKYVDYGVWLAAPRSPDWFDGQRILVREVTTKGIIQGTLVDGDFVFSNSVDGVRVFQGKININALLGIINSKLISFYHINTSPNAFKGTFPKMLLKDLRDLPIPDFQKKTKIYNNIVTHVQAMLQLNKDLQQTNTPNEKQQLQNRIAYTDRKIDELVYELYGLNEEEIKIVEETN